jgi:hypothetical protein
MVLTGLRWIRGRLKNEAFNMTGGSTEKERRTNLSLGTLWKHYEYLSLYRI